MPQDDTLTFISHDPNRVVSLLKVCAKQKDLIRGTKIHAGILRSGLLKNNKYVGNSLVTMYAKCGAISQAQEVFIQLPVRDVVSWNALITGYAQHNLNDEALALYEQMQLRHVNPNVVTYLSVLRACGNLGDSEKGHELHSQIVREDLLKQSTVVGTALIDVYAKCGLLEKAQEVFDELTNRNIVSWNALIAGYVRHGLNQEALNCYQQMQDLGFSSDAVTLTSVLKACASIQGLSKGEEIHAQILKDGLLENDAVIGNALVDMYAKCGFFDKAEEVFKQLQIQDVVSYNALIGGYVQHDLGEKALKYFEQMQHQGIFPDVVSYINVLGACGSIYNPNKAIDLHVRISGNDYVTNDMVVLHALMVMYATCGALTKMEEVFNQLPTPNTISWNVLIGGYLQHNHNDNVLNCFVGMQIHGFPPNSVTFTSVLKACGAVKAVEKAQEIHSQLVAEGILGTDKSVNTALVDAYAKCNLIKEAENVFEKLVVKDYICWAALIAGYVEQKYYLDALVGYERMQQEGLFIDAGTYVFILKACGNLRALDKGQEIHMMLVRQGLSDDMVSCTGLVDMYATCGLFTDAENVFNGLKLRDIVLWNVLIAGYVHYGHHNEALNCFKEMHFTGISPNITSFAYILRACGSTGTLGEGQKTHSMLVRTALEDDEEIDHTLVDMYAKCGRLEEAKNVFHKISIQNVRSFNALISGYVQHGCNEEALLCFEHMHLCGILHNTASFIYMTKACSKLGNLEKAREIHATVVVDGLLKNDPALNHSFVDMYAKCAFLEKAQEMFDELLAPNVASWNVLISGYVQWGFFKEAFNCFDRMHEDGVSANSITFNSVLKACAAIKSVMKGHEMHSQILKRGLLESENVTNSLIDMYVKCSMLSEAQLTFNQLEAKDIVSWNTLIAGYSQYGHIEEASYNLKCMQIGGISPDPITIISILKACGRIRALGKGQYVHAEFVSPKSLENDIVVGTALLDMYAKCGELSKAQIIFDGLQDHNTVSFNALITGYIQHGRPEEALDCFGQMQNLGIIPNDVTCVCVSKSCGNMVLTLKGQELHIDIVKKGFLEETSMVGNALVDMYVKFGMVMEAQSVFDMLGFHNLVSWNTLIGGYAQIGKDEIVFTVLDKMTAVGEMPDPVTFTILLSTCSHTGMVYKGPFFMDTMITEYGVIPTFEHYACMIDLFGRAGQLEKAMTIIMEMPFASDLILWNTMLGACQIHGNLDLAKLSFEHAVKLDANDTGPYVGIRNVYSAVSWLDTCNLELLI